METRALRPVQAIIFDYGGVVRRDGRVAFDGVDAAVGLPPGTLWEVFHDIPEYRLSRDGTLDAPTFRAAIRRALVPRAGGEARADHALASLDAHLAALPPVDPDMRALIERLRAGGRVKLGMLSNGPRGYTARLSARGVTALFDDAFVSGDVGLAKPDPEVYRFAARRLGVEPGACLMVDDQARNVDGALAAGLRTHFFEYDGLAKLRERLTAEGVLG
jgi:HAD superfamily hydrolase (TIGR01509 family)